MAGDVGPEMASSSDDKDACPGAPEKARKYRKRRRHFIEPDFFGPLFVPPSEDEDEE